MTVKTKVLNTVPTRPVKVVLVNRFLIISEVAVTDCSGVTNDIDHIGIAEYLLKPWKSEVHPAEFNKGSLSYQMRKICLKLGVAINL